MGLLRAGNSHWQRRMPCRRNSANVFTSLGGGMAQLESSPLPPLPSHRDLVAAADLQQVLPDGVGFAASVQRRALAVGAPRSLLADEMGLGKTLTALLAAAPWSAVEVRVLVIAPVGLHCHWRQEADAVGLSIALDWSKLPRIAACRHRALVDEAHFAQSIRAKRTSALLRLARHPRLRAIWMITGTPMKNGRPAQLTHFLPPSIARRSRSTPL